jgi:hypothetical protein
MVALAALCDMSDDDRWCPLGDNLMSTTVLPLDLRHSNGDALKSATTPQVGYLGLAHSFLLWPPCAIR